MKKIALKNLLNIGLILFLCSSQINLQAKVLSADQLNEVESILNSYVMDYQNDVTLKKDVSFGIKVDEHFWNVKAMAPKDGSPAKVILTEGEPAQPTFYFYTDIETLRKINKGEMNALTASAKAFSTDFAPFDADVMEGFQPDGNFMSTLFSVYFHFWTKGDPEVIPFGVDYTRESHGAQAAIFYYMPGFRSAYVVIKKGQHANKNEKSKSNPFPSMLVLFKGEGKAIINGNEIDVRAGESIVIPPGVTHEFMNPDNEEPLEGILLMFGEGA